MEQRVQLKDQVENLGLGGEVAKPLNQRNCKNGLTRAWCPSWAMEWDMLSGRYGAFVGDVSHEWKRLSPVSSLKREQTTDTKDEMKYWEQSASERLPAMVESLEMSLVSLQNPWMTPKYTQQEVDVGDKQRPRLLFQYKPYEEQDRLILSDTELSGAIDAVFSQESSELHEARDAGMVILIKIIIDAYLEKGPEIAFQQVFTLLKKPLSDGRTPQCAVFDVISNLMIHSELLYSDSTQSACDGDDAWSQRVSAAFLTTIRNKKDGRNGDSLPNKDNVDCAAWPPISMGEFVQASSDLRLEQFREWLRRLLFDLSAHLGTIEDKSERLEDSGSDVWASVFSCVASLCTHDGYFVLEYMQLFPLHVLRRMLHVARHAFWATRVRSLLNTVLCNLLYVRQNSEDDVEKALLDFRKIEEFGGIQNIVKEYYYASTTMSSQSLFCVLLDYVLNDKSGDQKTTLGPPAQGGTWGFSISETFEVQVVASALLHMNAALALKDYLLLPAMEKDAEINKQLSHVIHNQILSLMGANFDEEMVQERVPLAFIEYCMTALKDMTSKTHFIPDIMEQHVKSTCDAGIFGESDSEHWKFLENALLSESPRNQVIGRSWLVKLMISASDREIEEAWVSRKNVIPPPVPLMPSSTPEKDLFTCGDTILSAFAKSKSKTNSQGYLLTYRSFEGDDFVVTNFALAIRQVVSAIRFRMLELPGDLHTKWNSGAVDTNRLCISTIERAFEWIFGFSSAPEWSTAVALLAECLISTMTICDIITPPGTASDDMHADGDADDNSNAGTVSRPSSGATVSTPRIVNALMPAEGPPAPVASEAARVAPLHIPSPSSDQEGDMLSPLSKLVPGGPKIAAAWRRLRTPGTSRNRPTSGESQHSNADDFAHNRPLSAGVMKMDSTRTNTTLADSIYNTRDSLNTFTTTGYQQTVPRSWRSLADKVQHRRAMQRKEYLNTYTSICDTVSAFSQTIDAVERFITGISSCPVYMIEMMSPVVLKDVFDAMKQVDIDGVKLMESSSRHAAVQAGKPFWDSRLAIFILLVCSFTMTDKNQYNHPLLKTKGYLQTLVRDPDVRVRHHACLFILRRFCDQDREGYIKALATIVSRAQQANDDKLLRDPEAQVNKMLEMRLFDMTTLTVSSTSAS